MILALTINPLLERRYIYPEMNWGKENRNGERLLAAGGKGINVSRQLNNLNVNNLSYTFLGGVNGKILKEILSKEKINFTSIRTECETRDAAIVIDKSKNEISTFFGIDSKVSESEVDEYKAKLEKMIQNSKIVVLSGSSPCQEADSIFPFAIESANKYDKISICDTYGNHLKDCIEAGPTVIHNNFRETKKSLNIPLETEKEILEYLGFLYSKGVKQSYLTNGAGTSYASNFDYKYKVENPEIKSMDPTGSGDSFTAGIAYSWHNNFTYEETLFFSSSLGAANASKYETCDVTFKEAEMIRTRIKVYPVGKKIKTSDVLS